MSNVFNNELENALKEVFEVLASNELQQKKDALSAKLKVYFAHGVTEKASNKLILDQDRANRTGKQYNEATKSTEICKNIITAATAAETDARNTNKGVSTAAVQIENAANSLTNLLADVSGVLAISISKDFGNEINSLAELAYKLTRRAAEEGERATLQSLNTTIEAAQSQASVVRSQSEVLSADMESLLKVLNQNYAALQDKVNADATVLAEAIAKENAAEGIFKTAREEKNALISSQEIINEDVNYDLKYFQEGDQGERFRVSFNTFWEQDSLLQQGKKDYLPVIDEYRILFVEKDAAAAFDIHAAKTAQYYYTIDDKLGQKDYKMDFVTADYHAYLESSGKLEEMEKLPQIAKDYMGKDLQRGVSYVFFVNLVYTAPLPPQMKDTDGYLSLPSLDFTLRTQLPIANQPKLTFYSSIPNSAEAYQITDAVRVSFTIGIDKLRFRDIDLLDLVDFRVILFNEENTLASRLNNFTAQQVEELFKLDEAYRLSEQVYLEAKEKYETAIANGVGDIDLLKGRLAYAEMKFDNRQAIYQEQQEVINMLNNYKISDFFLDRDILNSIPMGFTLSAQPIGENYLNDLEVQKGGLVSIKDGQAQELKQVQELYDQISKEIQKISDKNSQLEKKIASKLKRIQKLLRDIEELENKYNASFKKYLEMDDLEDVKKQLSEMALEVDLEKIIKCLEEIVRLNREVEGEELELSQGLKDIRRHSKDKEPLEEQIANLKKEIEINDYRVHQIEKELKELNENLFTNTVIFVAQNTEGDFVDNYGEPMIKKQKYNALIYTVVNSEETEVLSRFIPGFSTFSNAAEYNPVQF